jgi:hypothetical protein
MAYTYSKIATYTVGSGGVASIDFTNIPQTYTDLVLKCSLRTVNNLSARGTNINLSINGVTTNRTFRSLEGNGASAFSSNGTGAYVGTFGGGTSVTADTFSNTEIYLPNYASSNNKSLSTDSVMENNGTTGSADLVAVLWSQTSAITSLSISSGSGNLAQHSTAHLYGIKAEL